MSPAPHRPSTWQVTWRTGSAAVAGFLIFLVAQGASLPPEGQVPTSFIGWMFLDFFLGIAAVGLLPLALRRAPLGAGLPIIATTSFSSFAIVACCITVIEIAALRRVRELTAAVGVFMASVAAGVLVYPTGGEPIWPVFAVALGLLAVLVLIGLNRGAGRALVAALRQEAQSARREQDARIEQARLAERTRIAREMHDTLAHRLSLISMHAGALEYRTGLDAETIRSTAGMLRDTAQKASQELRTVLTVLREGPSDTSPQPDLESLPGLVDTARAAGTDITLNVAPQLLHPEVDQLPDATSRHLYRVVQECITNAQKHAPGHPVSVDLAGGPGQGITITASNPVSGPPPPPSTAGLGLVGLEERARLAGGSFEAARHPGRWITTVQVPW